MATPTPHMTEYPPQYAADTTPPVGDTDPLIGMQADTDSPAEAARAPEREVTLHAQPAGSAVKSRATAGMLGLFLGGLGVHRFYLGFTQVGLFQLCFTMGIFLVGAGVAALTGATIGTALAIGAGVAMLGVLWGFFEGLLILLGSIDSDERGRPLRGR